MNDYKHIISFPNGYGASIVCNQLSYGGKRGLFEVAVLKQGELCYSTPITGDVLGFLNFSDVVDILKQIEELPSAES